MPETRRPKTMFGGNGKGFSSRPDTDSKLESETRKWLARLEEQMKETAIVSDSPLEKKVLDNSMTNVHSYVKDCRHFLSRNDFINAFEAIIYAWGIYETLERMGLVRKK